MCDASHTEHKLTDALNETHDVFDSLTNLVNKHVRKVFLKSMSCLSCDFDVIGDWILPVIAKADDVVIWPI